MSSLPSFPAFFRALYGVDPFPWQDRLAGLVAGGCWPSEIGVPTGLGKTACIDIAVWSLAAQADRTPAERSVPTRTWYVVNRRLLVDAAYKRATDLSRILRDPEALGSVREGSSRGDVDVVAAVAGALVDGMRGARAECGPLFVARLRGGAELGRRAPEPSQPAVILATLPMYASRFLLRGYGSSRSMRPVDAALAGVDSLVLLDEAHLSRALEKTARQAAACDTGDPGVLLPSPRHRPVFVSLTATGERREGGRFDLDEVDHLNEVVRRRLSATKPTTLVATEGTCLAATMTEAALGLVSRRQASSCVVFCNTVRTARSVKEALDREAPAAIDVWLATGRQRERESEWIRRDLLDDEIGVASGRPARGRERSLVVVSTQTLEVGADVDFDFLVSETAGARALVQRFGRLNRLGDRAHAAAEICHPTDMADWPVYGTEPAEVWRRLSAVEGPIDLAPAYVSQLVGEPADEPRRSGELLPHHLWEYAKTSQQQVGEAPPELFFDALPDEDRLVTVCWRANIPGADERLLPAVSEAEAVEVPVGELRGFLRARGLDAVAKVATDGATLEEVELGELRPGDVVVLGTTAGGYDSYGWSDTATGEVLDVSMLDGLTLPLVPGTLGGVLDRSAASSELAVLDELIGTLAQEGDDGEPWSPEDEAEVVARLTEALCAQKPHPWIRPDEWEAFGTAMAGAVVRRTATGAGYLIGRGPGSERAGLFTDAFDDLSFLGADARSPALAEHLSAVGDLVARVARSIGLPENLVEVLVAAGRSHDLGKADHRFQRWLDPEARAAELLAKSGLRPERSEAARVASGWPRGGRHEVLSARLLTGSGSLATTHGDLLVHLVLAHHGHGRPLVLPVHDGAATAAVAEVGGEQVSVSGDLSAVDWEQPARFRSLCERYGIWGLALLETIVRQADHAASSVVEVA